MKYFILATLLIANTAFSSEVNLNVGFHCKSEEAPYIVYVDNAETTDSSVPRKVEISEKNGALASRSYALCKLESASIFNCQGGKLDMQINLNNLNGHHAFFGLGEINYLEAAAVAKIKVPGFFGEKIKQLNMTCNLFPQYKF